MTAYADQPWLQCYESEVPHQLEYPQVTVHQMLERSAKMFPERTALIFKGTKISYRELNQLSDHIAAALVQNGFEKGDRAVIYMPNSPQFIIAYYGILKAGGIVIATNPLYTERELEHQLADCGAATVFVLSLYYDKLKKVQSQGETRVKRIIVANVKEYLPAHLRILFTLFKEGPEGHRVQIQPGDMSFQDFLAAGSQAPPAKVDVSPDDVALLQYTGGTTGVSKGAIGLHRNLVANTYMVNAWLTDCTFGSEVVLASIPLFHSFGMIVALNFGIMTGSEIVLIIDPRDQKDLLGSINKYEPTIFPGVPAMYNAINNNSDVAAGKYDIESIRVCVSGSAPLLQETKRRFEELTGAKLVEGFGLTEAHVVTHCNPIYGENRPGSIGLPMVGMEARIVDPEDPDRILDVNEIGELVVRGPSIMQGYWQMPTETKNTLRDGWLYTGDIARMDEDGYFYIEDRKKDMIIAGGYNVYPREVEEVLATHPAVMEVAVAGVPDPHRGETVKAWIVTKEGTDVSAEEIIAWSKERLAKYKYPRLVEFRDELPKSTVGKVLKRELVEDEKQKAEPA
ncbi:MAG: long-chain fatty acid--CoA ligase [Candidatus Promineifilaceae bacterium]|nr:long-chain fatty acid--CoA ligase [Candidatus Promineifilaceae bacterium]